MSWFDDNAEALEAANISREDAEDFVRRNTTTDESGTVRADYHRVFEALGEEDQPEVRQSSGAAGGGDGVRPVTLQSVPYTPWTRSFVPSLGALPADLMQPITERFTPTAMPTDLLDKWDRQFTAPDPATLQTNPVVQARLALGRDAAEKSAAARGTLFTGGFAKGLNEFGQQVASEEYDNIYNRARGEFLDAFGMFSGDRSRRQGVWTDQNAVGLNAFNANTGLTLADRGQRAGIYGDQWNRDFAKEGFDYSVFRNNQLDPFGMGTDLYRLGQGDWSLRQGDRRLSQEDRALDESLRMGSFNRNRLSDIDAFGKYVYTDSSYWDRIFRGLDAGRN